MLMLTQNQHLNLTN